MCGAPGKKRKDGAATFHYGKGRTEREKGGPAPSEIDLSSGGDIYADASDAILSNGSATCECRIEKSQVHSIAN